MPRDHNPIHGAISASITHTIPCNLCFKTLEERGDDPNISDTVTRANDDFAGVGVPHTSGFSIMLGQLGRVLAERYFPR
jgi:hypothetical protein